jgi:hypothetical protein
MAFCDCISSSSASCRGAEKRAALTHDSASGELLIISCLCPPAIKHGNGKSPTHAHRSGKSSIAGWFSSWPCLITTWYLSRLWQGLVILANLHSESVQGNRGEFWIMNHPILDGLYHPFLDFMVIWGMVYEFYYCFDHINSYPSISHGWKHPDFSKHRNHRPQLDEKLTWSDIHVRSINP